MRSRHPAAFNSERDIAQPLVKNRCVVLPAT